MGGGTYSFDDRAARSAAKGYATKSAREIFTARDVNSAMNPYGVEIRESRDSAEHPNSLAVVIALDVTGSMGSVPHFLVKEGLPAIMATVLGSGVADPQVLFLGIGDHECDSAPLQVGQFESSDELLDKWLTDTYLEGGGGSNAGESYLLAWYFAAYHTTIDCFEKRGKKGYLFTIGDEPTLQTLPAAALKRIMGASQAQTLQAEDLLAAAMAKYNVFHIHVLKTNSGSRRNVVDGWRQMMADNLILAERRADVAGLIAAAISGSERGSAAGADFKVKAASAPGAAGPEEMML
jgi:hypothetical protein